MAFDIDTNRIALGQARGHSVHFGDMADPAILKGAGLADASAVVVTMDDSHKAEKVISNIRLLYPAVAIFARARDFKTKDALLASGVTHVVPEAAEGGINLGAAVLQGIGVSDTELEALVADFRRDDYEIVRSAQGA